MRIPRPSQSPSKKRADCLQSYGERGFTMIEIAIAVGVIGFALVAIIGILPRGMNVQKTNREDTIISQDAPYFLNAIRNGEMRTNNNFLINYVESITIVSNSTASSNSTTFTYYNPALSSGTPGILTNDMIIVGLLGTPRYDIRFSNQFNFYPVSAIVHGMTGAAIQQGGANAITVLRYQMNVEIDPWNYAALGPAVFVNPQIAGDYLNFMASNMRDVRLKFTWPVFPNNSLGNNYRTYRSTVSSHLSNTNSIYYPLWFFQPNTYTSATNS